MSIRLGHFTRSLRSVGSVWCDAKVIDCPTGKSPKVCPALSGKIFPLPCRANHGHDSARLTRQEGRIAIVTNAGEDAVDAAASARKVIAGRFSVSDAQRADERRQRVRQNRVVLAPVAGVKLPVANSVRPDRSAIKPAVTVTKQNSSPGRSRHKP
jgi:hypothetical protein